MPKHIAVDELKEWVENWFYVHRTYHPYSKSNDIPVPELYDILERMPTADVVELVRCRNCKWYRTEYGWNCAEYTVCGISPTYHPIRSDNDFCSFGERKETEDE